MISEYDAFGPWVYPIDEKHGIPPLFAPYCKDEARIRLKVPREIERRNATPEMDLYDYVLSAYSDHLLVLKRRENDVEKIDIPYHTITKISVFSDLLLGQFKIFHEQGVLEIKFSGVSRSTMLDFARLIRTESHYARCIQEADFPDTQEWFSTITEVLFRNLLNNAYQGQQILSAAFQEKTMLRYGGRNFFEKCIAPFTKRTLPNMLHMALPGELNIIFSEMQERQEHPDAYNFSFLYIPLAAIRKIDIAEPTKYRETVQILLQTKDGSETVLPYPVENANVPVFYRQLRCALGIAP